MALRKGVLCLVAAGLWGLSLPQDSFAYDLSARTIYQQAKKGNHQYFQLLKRYRLAVDRIDVSGDTAYCMALKEKNVAAMNFLVRYGANANHQCVKRAQKTGRQPARQVADRNGSRRFVDDGFWSNDDHIWYGIGALAVGGGIAAIASKGGGHGSSGSGGSGSGGGGGGGDVPVGDLSDITKEELQTSEYTYGNFLDKIHAAEAYAKIYKKDTQGSIFGVRADGVVGLAKVKVGIIDGRVVDHNEYKNKIKARYTVKSLDAEIEESIADEAVSLSLQDDSIELEPMAPLADHGSHVAGIIVASKNETGMHGVAFENAELYTTAWDLDSTKSILPSVQNMIDSGVQVINNSWGATTETTDDIYTWINNPYFRHTIDSYVYTANHKAVWVQSTGNDHWSTGVLENALGGIDLSKFGYNGPGQYEVPYIAVTALADKAVTMTHIVDGQTIKETVIPLADYANYCGSSRNYCIAAPGTMIYSTGIKGDNYVAMQGTSMAAPVVTGSIALLKGYYPWLSAQNVAWLLLETANHSGIEYSNSNKYGRGVLDLEAAVNTPIGDLGLSTNATVNSLISVQNSRIAGSSVMNRVVKNAMPEKITVFDALKRPFEYNTANMVSTTHASNANLRNEVARAGVFKQKKKLKDEKTGFQFNTSESLKKDGQAHLSSVDVVNESETGSTRFYYAENSKYDTAESVLKPTDNPYFAMNEAYGAENTLNLSETSKLKLSLQTGENGLYGRDYEQDKYDFDEQSYAVGAEYSFNLTDYLELATVGGLLYEEDAVLGLNGQGALAFKDGSTYYMGLKAKLNLTPNVALLAAYYRGYTEGQSSALMAISGLETESFMVAGEYQLNTKDKIGLSFSSPLTVRRGHATFNYASGRDNYSDTVYMKKLTSSLKPAAQEYDVGVYYLGEPKEELNVMGKIEARFNADGEKGVTDYIGVMGAQYAFPK